MVQRLEMDVAVFGDVNDISGVTGDDPTVDLDLQRAVNHKIILIIGQRPLKAGVVELHDAAAHAGRFLQRDHVLERHAILCSKGSQRTVAV